MRYILCGFFLLTLACDQLISSSSGSVSSSETAIEQDNSTTEGIPEVTENGVQKELAPGLPKLMRILLMRLLIPLYLDYLF